MCLQQRCMTYVICKIQFQITQGKKPALELLELNLFLLYAYDLRQLTLANTKVRVRVRS